MKPPQPHCNQQIHIIDAFCQNTGMELNLDKIEILVFRNGGGLRNYESWSYRGSPINNVPFYKYMGVYLTPTVSWFSTHNKLSIQAKKSIWSINQYQKSFGYIPINEYFKLFDTLVKPVLCYASQMLGYCYEKTIETIYNDFCKRYLCVNRSIYNSVALGECGRLPLCVFYMPN